MDSSFRPHWRWLLLAAIPVLTVNPTPIAANEKAFDEQVRPVLAKYCQECHGTMKPKGNFRLDRLSADFANTANRDRWLDVREQLKSGAMPPKEKPRPSPKEAAIVLDWIEAQMLAA